MRKEDEDQDTLERDPEPIEDDEFFVDNITPRQEEEIRTEEEMRKTRSKKKVKIQENIFHELIIGQNMNTQEKEKLQKLSF